MIGAEALRMPANFDEGMGRIWIDTIQCSGSEKMLTDCTADFSGVNPCTHTQDAGVRCLPGKYWIYNTFLRLLSSLKVVLRVM